MRDLDSEPDGEGEALRQIVMQAVEQCTDLDLLDLIYALLARSA